MNMLQFQFVQPFSNQVQFHILASPGWLCTCVYHPRQNAFKEKNNSTFFVPPWKIGGGRYFHPIDSGAKNKINTPISVQVFQSRPLVAPLSALLPDFSNIPISVYIPADLMEILPTPFF